MQQFSNVAAISIAKAVARKIGFLKSFAVLGHDGKLSGENRIYFISNYFVRYGYLRYNFMEHIFSGNNNKRMSIRVFLTLAINCIFTFRLWSFTLLPNDEKLLQHIGDFTQYFGCPRHFMLIPLA